MPVAFRSINSQTVSPTDPIIFTAPAGIIGDDLLLAFIVQRTNEAFEVTWDSIPTGWTTLRNSGFVGATGAASVGLFFRIANQADVAGSTTYSFGTTDPNNMPTAGHLMAFSGVDVSNPFGQTGINSNSVAFATFTNTVSAPVHNLLDESLFFREFMIVKCYGAAENTNPISSFTGPGGYTERGDIVTAGGAAGAAVYTSDNPFEAIPFVDIGTLGDIQLIAQVPAAAATITMSAGTADDVVGLTVPIMSSSIFTPEPLGFGAPYFQEDHYHLYKASLEISEKLRLLRIL